ncbi:MAG: hypothetical protein KF861_03400 [Planctomycetaceae bacterium]|nr:hypothetical protein [Planctomycetaceae bacterium]
MQTRTSSAIGRRLSTYQILQTEVVPCFQGVPEERIPFPNGRNEQCRPMVNCPVDTFEAAAARAAAATCDSAQTGYHPSPCRHTIAGDDRFLSLF